MVSVHTGEALGCYIPISNQRVNEGWNRMDIQIDCQAFVVVPWTAIGTWSADNIGSNSSVTVCEQYNLGANR